MSARDKCNYRPINCKETALALVLTVGNINSDATGFDMSQQIRTQGTNPPCRPVLDLFKFIGTWAEHYSSKKIKTTID